MNTVPEIVYIAALLQRVKELGSANKAASVAIGDLYGEIAGIDNRDDALYALLTVVQNIARLPIEIEKSGPRKIAEKSAARLKHIFRPTGLAVNCASWREHNLHSVEYVVDTLSVFEEIEVNVAKLIEGAPAVRAGIEEIRGKVAKNEELSEALKVLVLGQLTLIDKSLSRFAESGVVAFRDSVFSAYGRISISLEEDRSIPKATKRELADDILRLYGLFEAGSGVLGLVAPAAMKLLGAPVD